MSRESSTVFLEKKHPVIKAVIDYTFRRLELIIVTLLIGSVGAYFKLDTNQKLAEHQKEIQQVSTTVTNVVNYINP